MGGRRSASAVGVGVGGWSPVRSQKRRSEFGIAGDGFAPGGQLPGHVGSDLEAFGGEFGGRFDQSLPGKASESLVGFEESGDLPRDADCERPPEAPLADEFAVLDVEILARAFRCGLAKVESGALARPGVVDDQKPSAPDPAGSRMDDTARKRRRDGRVDGGASFGENVAADHGRRRVLGGDDSCVGRGDAQGAPEEQGEFAEHASVHGWGRLRPWIRKGNLGDAIAAGMC